MNDASLFIQLPSRTLKKPASVVLASLKGSTYRSVRLAASLTAALLNGLFEHPAVYSGTITLRIITAACRTKTEFFRKLLDEDVSVLVAEGLRDQRPHAGILIANRRASDFDLARRIMTVLNRFTPEEIANQLLYL